MGGDLGDLQTYHGARLIFIKMIKIVSYLVWIIWKFMNIKMTEKLFILIKILVQALGVPMILILEKIVYLIKNVILAKVLLIIKKEMQL